MPRLVITADIHGRYSAWRKIKNLLNHEDVLAIAGDLFDTRFGDRANPDFQPETIRQEFNDLNNQKHYVYGNCDIPDFFPGSLFDKKFLFENKTVLLIHGNKPFNTSNADIVITGHTHIPEIIRSGSVLFINPGSPIKPRGFSDPSCAIYENQTADILSLNF